MLASASDVTGTWELTVKASDGTINETVDLSLSHTNGRLTGTVGKGGTFVPLQDVAENGDELSFRVADDKGKMFSFRLTVRGNTLQGTFGDSWSVAGICTGWRPRTAALAALPTEFLTKNSQPLEVNDLDAGLLDTGGKRIFLLGEAHGLAVNDQLDLALLQYLYKKAGVRVYLAEWGYAAGSLMNRYLETGDEGALDFLMRESQHTVSWTREHRAFLVKFREWNATLPESERVRVVGLDIEHQVRIAAWFLRELATGAHEAPAGIRETANAVRQLDTEASTEAGMRKLSEDLAAGLKKDQREYADWLGTRLLEFELVVRNLRRRYEAYADRERNFDTIREAAMYETFLKLAPMLSGKKCYGRWGAAHVAQRQLDGRDPLAARLNRPESPAAGQVLTIWPLHHDCEALQMTGTGYRTRPFTEDFAWMKGLVEIARSPVTLFKLTGTGSPFARELYGFSRGDGVTTDYAQYFVLIREAQPTHLMEGTAGRPGEGH